jgi:hypothetical protein
MKSFKSDSPQPYDVRSEISGTIRNAALGDLYCPVADSKYSSTLYSLLSALRNDC